jgi:single-stranded-DNA-specific exonuclease
VNSTTTLPPRWRLPAESPHAEPLAEALANACRIPRSLARILAARGIATPAEAESFLNPALDQLLPPSGLRGISAATARIFRAISAQEPILLYGDYDVDGTCSIVILRTVLSLLGAKCEAFVPHRILDGYGMKEDRIRQAAGDGIRLIISVDTGIRAAAVVALATELGVDTIITDHHLPESKDTEASLPNATAVINPCQPLCTYPNKNLCGAGVALKLAQALLGESSLPDAKRERLLESLLKIAALATVADIVPLTGENRVIVKLGLAGLADVRNPGLRALMDVSGIRAGKSPTARQVGFQIGPRINAAGRMASASEVLELFFTSDESKARQIAATLDELNRERQDTEAEIRDSIDKLLAADTVKQGRIGLVLAHPDWHLGVAGIVAGRVAERHRKPTFVLAQAESNGHMVWKGSGRSIAGFHLLKALEAMPDLFHQHGGHEQAAGVTLPLENLEAFEERFAAYAAEYLDDDSRRAVLNIDAILTVPHVTQELYEHTSRLAPFGYHNPPPLFAIEDAEILAAPFVMKGKHVKFTVRQRGKLLNMKAWNVDDRWFALGPGDRVRIAFHLEEDSYDGWAAIAKDFQSATGH